MGWGMKKQKGFSWVELLVVLGILAIIASIAIPRLHEAEISANEASACSSIRSILTAQAAYYVTAGSGSYAPDLSRLAAASMIDSALGSGVKDGYTYQMSGSGNSFRVSADPSIPGQTGRKYYYADQTGVIRVSTDGPATAGSPPLGRGAGLPEKGGGSNDQADDSPASPGNSGNFGRPDNPGNSGNAPGNNGNGGRPGNPGNSGNGGRPENPGNSGDAGRPGNPGNSGNNRGQGSGGLNQGKG